MPFSNFKSHPVSPRSDGSGLLRRRQFEVVNRCAVPYRGGRPLPELGHLQTNNDINIEKEGAPYSCQELEAEERIPKKPVGIIKTGGGRAESLQVVT